LRDFSRYQSSYARKFVEAMAARLQAECGVKLPLIQGMSSEQVWPSSW